MQQLITLGIRNSSIAGKCRASTAPGRKSAEVEVVRRRQNHQSAIFPSFKKKATPIRIKDFTRENHAGFLEPTQASLLLHVAWGTWSSRLGGLRVAKSPCRRLPSPQVKTAQDRDRVADVDLAVQLNVRAPGHRAYRSRGKSAQELDRIRQVDLEIEVDVPGRWPGLT